MKVLIANVNLSAQRITKKDSLFMRRTFGKRLVLCNIPRALSRSFTLQ